MSDEAAVVVGVIGTIFLILAIALGVYALIYPFSAEGFKYNSEVHAHMENAYYAADPNTMLSEITLARDGMDKVGLKEDMYNGIFPWDKRPDRSMKWQYKHIDSIVTRINEFKTWEKSQIGDGTTQQMKDVYTEKLDNVRNFIKDDGWSDDVAEATYKSNIAASYMFAGWLAGLLAVLGFACYGLIRVVEG